MSRSPRASARARLAPIPLILLYPLFFATVYLSHLTLLRLPYFWDEAGYYIPAAWDLFRTGTLIPQTTLTNAHPPLPSILLVAWWHLSGFVPSGTRTLLCMVTAAALLAVFRLARGLLGTPAAAAVTLLTAIYPVWFAQSTLAHADTFAAAFTLWALTLYFDRTHCARPHLSRISLAALLFSLAALSKETSIVTPLALGAWELAALLRKNFDPASDTNPHPIPTPAPTRIHLQWLAALLTPLLPLAAWYAYHYHRTGYVFGNPEYLRYNATANLDALRLALSLYHRLLQLTLHMNLYVPTACALAALLMPALANRPRLPRTALATIGVILAANWLAFSVLGGALLTRYLLPMYPLIFIVYVSTWQHRIRRWGWLVALSAAALLAALWVNPPYAFAPEDNLAYRDMIVLHQRAIAFLAKNSPGATVLTAWPATSELERPELGYTHIPIRAVPIANFTFAELQRAAQDPGAYDTALLFSTKWTPPPGSLDLGRIFRSSNTRYFDFHEDLSPSEAARLLHGEIIWQQRIGGEWAAILRFPRIEDASVKPDSPVKGMALAMPESSSKNKGFSP